MVIILNFLSGNSYTSGSLELVSRNLFFFSLIGPHFPVS